MLYTYLFKTLPPQKIIYVTEQRNAASFLILFLVPSIFHFETSCFQTVSTENAISISQSRLVRFRLARRKRRDGRFASPGKPRG